MSSKLFTCYQPQTKPNEQLREFRADFTLFFREAEITMSALRSRRRTQVTSYSDWMSQLPAELHSIPLFDLIIPGMKMTLTEWDSLHATTMHRLYHNSDRVEV